jgi:hypothetical protein
VSEEGLLFEDAPDSERYSVYGKLGILDLFEPTPSQGAVILRAKAAEGRALIDRESSGSDASAEADTDEWERLSALDAERYQDRTDAWRFTHPPLTNAHDTAGRIKLMRAKMRLLELFAKGRDKKAI